MFGKKILSLNAQIMEITQALPDQETLKLS